LSVKAPIDEAVIALYRILREREGPTKWEGEGRRSGLATEFVSTTLTRLAHARCPLPRTAGEGF